VSDEIIGHIRSVRALETPYRPLVQNVHSRLDLGQALSTKVLSDAQISPDGIRVAFVVGEANRTSATMPRSRLWLTDLASQVSRPLMTSGDDLAPRWSPDGRFLAFLSNRAGADQFGLYVARDDWGEAESIAALPSVADSIKADHQVELGGTWRPPVWSADGSRLAYLVDDPSPRQDPLLNRPSAANSRVWVADLAAGTRQVVSPPELHVWDFDLSIDGSFLMLVSPQSGDANWYSASLIVVDASGTLRTVTGAEPLVVGSSAIPRQTGRPVWSPDGSQFALISGLMSDRGLIGGSVIVGTPSGGMTDLTGNRPSTTSWIEWLGPAELLVASWTEGEQELGRLSLDGEYRSLWRAQAALADRYQPRFSVASTGRVAAVMERPDAPRELWVADVSEEAAAWRQMTQLQKPVESAATGELVTVHWQGSHHSVQGLLLLPPQDLRTPALPTVVFAHGGPVFLHQYLYHGWPEGPYGLPLRALSAAGYAVFMPNPRGSMGWGRGFVDALAKEHLRADVEDILSGVDHLVKQGVSDPARLGMAGWSSAGSIAGLVATTSDRFQAVMVGAAVSDWRAFQLGRSEGWNFGELFVPGDPYDVGGSFDTLSPLLSSDRVCSKILIVHTEDDSLVPVEQAYALHRALLDHGKDVELVVYPRENHGIREREHQLDVTRRVVAFFDSVLR
jgi:dipeptidyl aminopeptidase/acylaminoacyl peptidase